MRLLVRNGGFARGVVYLRISAGRDRVGFPGSLRRDHKPAAEHFWFVWNQNHHR